MEEDRPLTKAERKELKRQQKHTAENQELKKQKKKKLGTYLLIAAAAALAGWWIFQSIIPIPPGEEKLPVDRIAASDWVSGNPKAPVVIVEYSDFQCPACKKYAPITNEILKAYPDQVAVVYRHFPLKQLHLQAELAAQAAEAAGNQGKFWLMHDLLFDRQEEWADNNGAKGKFIAYAQELGLDVNQFKIDLVSKETKGHVKADYLSGLENALSSTPSFFINGELVVNPEGLAGFQQAIDLKLQAATGSAQTK